MSELQEGWAGVEAAWTSPPPVEALQDGSDEGEAATPAADATAADAAAAGEEEEEDGTAAAEAQPQPSFRDAVLAACGAAAGGGGAAGGAAEPLPLLGVLEGAAARLDAMSLDDFPRLLAWSEGLCGISLLPLRCVRCQPCGRVY